MSASRPGASSQRRRLFWAGALLAAVTFAAYLPACRGAFVFDDITFLLQNKLVRAGDGLYRFWFTAQQTDFWPVTYSAFWIEWRLWGAHPLGYHLVNLGLHIGECLLLWAIFRRLRFPGAYVAAFLFAVHPVNVESVAWIIQLKNLMAMGFYLAAIWFFIGSMGTDARAPLPAGREVWRDYALSLLCFTLAMLSKGSVAILPAVLLGLMAWRRRLTPRDLLRTLPFFIVAGVLAATDVWFQKHGTGEVFRTAGLLERLLDAGGVIWFYLYKALVPLNLLFVYRKWDAQAGNPLWWVPLLAAVAVTALLLRYRKGCPAEERRAEEPGSRLNHPPRSPRLRGASSSGSELARSALFAWGYFCAALVPVMGFTDVYFMKFSLVADHYQHLALIGVVALAGAVWARTWHGRPEDPEPVEGASDATWPNLVAGIVILTLAVLTFLQCRIYRDPETLWSSVVAKNPGSMLAQNSLGNVYSDSGRLELAMARYQEALRIQPDFADTHNNLGMLLARTGHFAEATAQLEEALRLKPVYADAFVNLGNVLQQAGRNAEAIELFARALQLEPEDAEAHSDLGIALAGAGRAADAVAEFQTALQLDPDYADGYCNLGNALVAVNRFPEAVADYERALKLKPGSIAAHAGLGTALANLGRVPEAIAQLEQALQLNPNLAQLHYNLGTLLHSIGRDDDAKREFDAAQKLGSPP